MSTDTGRRADVRSYATAWRIATLIRTRSVRQETAKGATVHTLRHTCITNLVRARERESVIAALVGD